MSEPTERQEIWCTNCNRHVQFSLDLAYDGHYQITCPNCGHLHYRVVVGGKVTEGRWHPSILWTPPAGNITASYASMYSSTSATTFLSQSWANTSSATGGF